MLGARHGLHDITGERWMQVSEEADAAAIGANGSQHACDFWLGNFLRLHGLPFFVHCLEPAAVQEDILRILAAENGIGLCSRSH